MPFEKQVCRSGNETEVWRSGMRQFVHFIPSPKCCAGLFQTGSRKKSCPSVSKKRTLTQVEDKGACQRPGHVFKVIRQAAISVCVRDNSNKDQRATRLFFGSAFRRAAKKITPVLFPRKMIHGVYLVGVPVDAGVRWRHVHVVGRARILGVLRVGRGSRPGYPARRGPTAWALRPRTFIRRRHLGCGTGAASPENTTYRYVLRRYGRLSLSHARTPRKDMRNRTGEELMTMLPHWLNHPVPRIMVSCRVVHSLQTDQFLHCLCFPSQAKE